MVSTPVQQTSQTIAAALAVIMRRRQQQEHSREAEAWRARAEQAEASTRALLRGVAAHAGPGDTGAEPGRQREGDAAMPPAGGAAPGPQGREAALETLLHHAARLLQEASSSSSTGGRAPIEFIRDVLLRSPSSDLSRTLGRTAIATLGAAVEAACTTARSSSHLLQQVPVIQQAKELMHHLLQHASQLPAPGGDRAGDVLQALQQHPFLLQLQLLACAEACSHSVADLLALTGELQRRQQQQQAAHIADVLSPGNLPKRHGGHLLSATSNAAVRMAALHSRLSTPVGTLLQGLAHLPHAVHAALDHQADHAAAMEGDKEVGRRTGGAMLQRASVDSAQAIHAQHAPDALVGKRQQGSMLPTLALLERAVEVLAGALCQLQRCVAEGGGRGLACALPHAAVGRAVARLAVALQRAAHAERSALAAAAPEAQRGGRDGAEMGRGAGMEGLEGPAAGGSPLVGRHGGNGGSQGGEAQQGGCGERAAVWRYEACWRLCLRLREAMQPAVAFDPER